MSCTLTSYVRNCGGPYGSVFEEVLETDCVLGFTLLNYFKHIDILLRKNQAVILYKHDGMRPW